MRAWRSASSKAMPRVAHASCVVGCERANATRRAQHTRSTRTQHNTHAQHVRNTTHTHSSAQRNTHNTRATQRNTTRTPRSTFARAPRRAVPCRAVSVPVPCLPSGLSACPTWQATSPPTTPPRSSKSRQVYGTWGISLSSSSSPTRTMPLHGCAAHRACKWADEPKVTATY